MEYTEEVLFALHDIDDLDLYDVATQEEVKKSNLEFVDEQITEWSLDDGYLGFYWVYKNTTDNTFWLIGCEFSGEAGYELYSLGKDTDKLELVEAKAVPSISYVIK